MGKQADASIILTCYNIEQKSVLFRQALQSVFAQSFQDFEVIVVDDASSDSTEALIKDQLGALDVAQDVSYLRLAENGGTSIARNQGIAKSRGEFIFFLDYDDLYLPGYLETSIGRFRAHPDTALHLCATYFYHFLAGEEKVYASSEDCAQLNAASFEEMAARCMVENFPVAMGSGVSCRRSLFTQHEEMYYDVFLSKQTAEDLLFGYQALALGIRPFFIEQPLVVHRSFYKGESRGTSAFLAADELQVANYIFRTAGSVIRERVGQEASHWLPSIDAHRRLQLEDYSLKNAILAHRYLSSLAMLLRRPWLAKTWLRYVLLQLSQSLPLGAWRDRYLFSRVRKEDAATSAVRSLLETLPKI